jgi:hypothetical protein
MYKIVLSLLLLLAFHQAGFAQDAGVQSLTEDEKKPSSPDEFRTKAEIDRAEDKLRKMMRSLEELNRLAQEVTRSTGKKTQLSGEDQKKLSKIEKIAKSVRTWQGGADDEELADPPQTLEAALLRLQSATDEIEKQSCKVTRHGISVQLIERANEVIAVTKVIKKIVGK